MQGLVTVFGGSGFIGAQVVRALAKRGYRVRVAVRRPGLAYKMRMLGDVGQIEVVQANVRAPASVARALEGAQACVNLVGVLYEAGRQKFQSLHAMGAHNIAEAAAAAGVASLVQVSAIGADASSPAKYARTKALGEAEARKAFPGAVILRPSIVFGPGDHFFNRFGQMAALSPVLPLIGGGETLFQPVFVGDVASAVAACVADPSTAGKTYELGGPATYSFKALMQLMLQVIGRHPFLAPIPFPLAKLIGTVGDAVAAVSPFPPPLTADQVELLKVDNVVAKGALGLGDLGISPTAVEVVIPAYLFRYRKGGQYAEALASGA
ncbi:complex I NDUFA9 subunit family protein [Phenylobacterium montanum]|uniref:Complex I NDUFA9 subunit family protein n=1 Tax=Phenylobacterium montanum TaxID=2823693 RepID=A0A975FWN9_9CAUL|nr:complex I NDUFA9 subunit family protein [Caulobacter sp. S6]QUD86232.1 complex I NDUFA9 subunit family protein [Caulobacter sp. S6]